MSANSNRVFQEASNVLSRIAACSASSYWKVTGNDLDSARSMSEATEHHSWNIAVDLVRWKSLTMSYISSPSLLCFALSFVLTMPSRNIQQL
ncbi:hypothetical protein E2542_SST18045 [Spatholobus suberectus]|nr:hypothetical protein E2542_SST18045 [Spatholobus suberectus]